MDGVPIMLGSMGGIGTVVADDAIVRGEGGPTNPQLVIPLKFQMPMVEGGQMFAILSLTASLGTEQTVWPQSAVCPPVTETLLGGQSGFRLHSTVGDQTRPLDLRFYLTPAQVERLERKRNTSTGEPMRLYLLLSPVVAAVSTHNEQPGQVADPGVVSLDHRVGIYAKVQALIWTTSITTFSVEIETSRWVKDVLPGLGYDCVRLIEVVLPPVLPDHATAAAQYDKAKAALDSWRYDDAIEACKALVSMWSKKFGGSKAKPVAQVIGDTLGWPEGDARRLFVDGLWESLTKFTNTARHPERNDQALDADYRDARLTVMLLGLLSEYLGSVRP